MEEPPQAPHSQPIKTYTLQANSISYTKSTTTIPQFYLLKSCTTTKAPISILQNITITAYPSQILAIVGPSGAGKSTLLDILAARTSPTAGTLLLNSSPLTASSYRKLSAYVPQHDTSLPVLTVYETFAFAASLLQPKNIQISHVVTSLLTELGLMHLAHTRLGHNLSGGERRRVSIGLSLLHDPGVLLLDEPTSGLDSSSAYNVMQTLKSIAITRGRTVILSIHQPSFKILSTIDRILLLSKGSVLHHGTLVSLHEYILSSGFTVPPQLNSLEYAMEILNQLQTAKLITPSPADEVTPILQAKNDAIRYRSTRVQEIVALYSRVWKIIYRTKQLLLTNTLQALVVGIVLGTIYINIGYDKSSIGKRFVHILTITKPQMEEPPQAPHSQPIKTYTLQANSISYTKSTTTIPQFYLLKSCTTTKAPISILQNITITAYPSQILAIVGPSGAGKSTLLDILAARTSPTAGTLLLNSSPLTASSYRKLSAYVPQHDTSLPVLTVYETFAFAASLLQPKNIQISHVVTSLLTELGLMHLAHTRLGHNLSGGERRRVSIGLSLLHDPGVLLLDEPTSGLDSSSAYNVMQTLKSIAITRGRTVILSIHQPSFKILSTIDRILLLSKGSVLHHGTLVSLHEYILSSGFTVPPQLNSLEYAMEILNQLQAAKLITPSPADEVTPILQAKNDVIRYRSTRVQEIVALYSRFWKIIYRTKQLLLTNTLQALVVGIVLGTIYINIGYDKSSIGKRFGLFAFTLTFLLSSTTETLPIN
ncbi:AAA+ ATPase domain-containing protein [Artemisia annua]|uniref:AAA+ ATPase domain-containing protein n=1 Tax=Artemisia annua TaxID=35608 RepID=A0A2U1Q852_ARTAN|nr:AAA+ ATPase domain-containing protein [Artemisia annua]